MFVFKFLYNIPKTQHMEKYSNPKDGAAGVLKFCKDNSHFSSVYVEVDRDGNVYVMGNDDLNLELPVETRGCDGYDPRKLDIPSQSDIEKNIAKTLKLFRTE